jgi:hypothetical protein
MSVTPSVPEQAMLQAHAAVFETGRGSIAEGVARDELRVEETIIDVPEDFSDPERVAVTHSPEEAFADRLGSASESDLQEQQIEVPQDEDERV